MEDVIRSAHSSAQTLSLTIASVADHNPTIALQNQLQALEGTFQLLFKTLPGWATDYQNLELPLQRVDTICKNLKEKIQDETSSGSQDWANLKNVEENIVYATQKLELYTSTIIVEITTVRIRKGTVTFTLQSINEFRGLIQDIQGGLMQRSQQLSQQLSDLEATMTRDNKS